MENDFFEDLDTLNIKKPTVITRVTEYIDKMKDYVGKLEDTGFAYELDGSVYFDTMAYESEGFSIHPLKVTKDYEGMGNTIDNKKDPRDFALWKKSKDGELSYQSKWGPGRVGWHLECSVMASDILGDHIDIHSGGIDLIFPHHQNEILQANAHSNNPNNKWINYFLHSGHLNIHGCKMSKSLKNFITIKDYLANIGTGQQLRILFLMHGWDKPLDYSLDTIDEAKWIDKRLHDFINHLYFVLKEGDNNVHPSSEFGEFLANLKVKVDQNIKDNFNTRLVMKDILDSTTYVYNYLETEYDNKMIKEYLEFILNTFTMFGLDYSTRENNNNDNDKTKLIKLAVDLRDDMRKVLMKYKKDIPKDAMREFFVVLDDFRDNKLANLGIKLQDRSQNKKTKYVIT